MNDHKIRFGKLEVVNGIAVETNVRLIRQSDIGKCPHVILVPDHYYTNGSCKCSDPEYKIMLKWGYIWSSVKSQWIVGG